MRNVIFITATGSEFGKLIVKTLSSNNFQVIAGMTGKNDKNRIFSEELSFMFGVEVVEVDTTNDRSVRNAFDYAISKYGAIDILINFTKVYGDKAVETCSLEHARQTFEVNFFGILRTYKTFMSDMSEVMKVLILNITSVENGYTIPYMVPYLTTKMRVEHLSDGLQQELKQLNNSHLQGRLQGNIINMVDGDIARINANKHDIFTDFEEGVIKALHAIVAVFK